MTGPPGILDVADGSWHRLCDLGWPVNQLGEEAAVFVIPLPNADYNRMLRAAGEAVRHRLALLHAAGVVTLRTDGGEVPS